MSSQKQDKISVEFRMIGNTIMTRRTAGAYLQALKWYNRAICFAKTGAPLAIAYSNRSEVYFNLFMFEDCLRSISLAIKTNCCPANILPKLRSREMECKVILRLPDPNGMEYVKPKLSYPPNEKVPFFADCLGLSKNKKYGEHLVTIRDLRVGDIVGIVEPFCLTTPSTYFFERCENCGQEKFQNLLPCPSCTTVMFCDEKCMNEAFENFHKYECPIMMPIRVHLGNQQPLLALRLVLRGISLFKDVDKFLEATKNMLTTGRTRFDLEPTDTFKDYVDVLPLKHVKFDPNSKIASHVGSLMLIWKSLFSKSELVSTLKPAELKLEFENVFKKYLAIVDSCSLLHDDLSDHLAQNCVGYQDISLKNNMLATFPLMYLMPYSCDPNVTCSSYTFGKIISVLRPIKAGEPLLHCLPGVTYIDLPKLERKKIVPLCNCTACVGNYPLYGDLLEKKVPIPREVVNYFSKAHRIDKENAQKIYRCVVDLLQQYSNIAPCKEIAMLRKVYVNIVKLIYTKDLCIAAFADPIIEELDNIAESPPGEVAQAVGDAIDIGYRHIDGAHLYLNEHEVGQGLNAKIKEGVVKREDMFITSKLWNSSHDTAYVRAAIDRTLQDLNTPYLDLYLIHWPMAYQPGGDPFPKDDKGDIIYSFVDFVDTWKEMEKAVDEGLIKSIGVSNFNKRQLEKLMSKSRIKPVVNQFECHPYLTQQKLSEFCKSIGVAVTAYAPLGSPNRPWVTKDDPVLLEDPKILSLTEKYNKTAAQVLIRYQIQRGHSVIPKSVTKSRILSNFEVFDFELSDEDMALIDTFNCNGRACPQAEGRNHPEWPFNDEY